MPDCLPHETLERLVSGQLTEEEDRALSAHVEGCPTCQAVLDGGARRIWGRAGGPIPGESDSGEGHPVPLLVRLFGVGDASETRPHSSDAAEGGSSEAQTPGLDPMDCAIDQGALGHYRIEVVIGRGGAGVVYRAFDERLRRPVAIKVLGRLAGDADLARFALEASAGAGIRHDHVISVFAVVAAEGRTPYLVMELVDGPNLAQRIAQEPTLEPREAARIIREAAEGLAAAHERGIIHRDVKPSNIFLDRATGRAKIGDFGLARLMHSAEILTRPDTVPGTVQYMSPEQIRDSNCLDGRTDVYALGVTLYEALTGELPFRGTPARVVHQLLNDEPVAPRRLSDRIPRDLETICLKCLEKDPQRRYPSAKALADDLRRHLDGKPVQARPVGALGQFTRWCRRNRAIAALSAAIVLVVIAAFAGVTWRWRKELAARDEARLQRDLAEARQYRLQLDEAERALREGRPQDARDVLLSVPAAQDGWETERLRHESGLAPYLHQRLAEHCWGLLDAALSPDGARCVSSGSDGQLLVWDVPGSRLLRTLAAGQWSPEGRRWLHYAEDRGRSPSRRAEGTYFAALCWLGEGPRIAAASLDGRGMAFDSETGRSQEVLRSPDPLYAVAADNDGSHVFFGGASGRVYLRSSDGRGEGGRERTVSRAAVLAAAWCDRRRIWIVGCADGTMLALDGVTLEIEGETRVPGPIWDLDVADGVDRRLLAVGCQRPELAVYEVVGNPLVLQRIDSLTLPAGGKRPEAVHAVRFSADGRRVYAIDNLGRLLKWDREAGRCEWIVPAVVRGSQVERFNAASSREDPEDLPLPFHRVGAAVLLPTGEDRVISAGEDRVVKIWAVGRNDGVTRLRTGTGPRIAFDPNESELLWTLAADGRLQVIDTLEQKPPKDVLAHAGGAAGLAVVHRTGAVVTAGKDARVRFWTWDGAGIRPARPAIRHGRRLLSIAASHDGRWVATVDVAAVLSVWEIQSGRRVFSEPLLGAGGSEPKTGRIAFNCDDTRLAAFGPGQSCLVFRTDPFGKLDEHPIVAGSGGTALLWHPRDAGFLLIADDYPRYDGLSLPGCPLGFERLGLRQPQAPCVGMESSPDGRRWFLLEQTGRIIVCDPEHLGEVMVRRSRDGSACDLAIDTEGRRLAVAHADGAIEIWETRWRGDPPSLIDDARTRWSAATLVEGPSAAIETNSRCVALDTHDRLGVLFLAKRGERDREGNLIFIHEEGGRVLREIIDDGGRVPSNAMCLAFGPDDEPIVVFRRAVPNRGPYDGSVQIARRRGPGKWALEQVLSNGNAGHYPSAVVRGGRVREIFHFSFAGYRWLHTFRDGALWKTATLGRAGDGLGLLGASDPDGHSHFAFRPNLFNSDPAPPLYARWDGKTLLREVIDPMASNALSIRLAPDRAPLVLVQRPITANLLKMYLARRTAAGWRCDALPAEIPDQRGDSDFALGKDGEIYLASWDRQLLLWRGTAGRWRRTIVADQPQSEGICCWTRTDSHGRPVIVAARAYQADGWIRAYRSIP